MKSTKRKRDVFEERAALPPRGRAYTVSIALPGSIVSNAQSTELKTYLVGQIARAAAVFNVDEIVVFSENGDETKLEGDFQGAHKSDPNVFMARVLQYLETPQYLRKALFPVHKDLKYAGLLNPLDCPHHLRANEDCKFREGVVVNEPGRSGSTSSSVNVGLQKTASIDQSIDVGTRVTVQLDDWKGSTSYARKKLSGKAVAPTQPREQDGLYWGYTVRLAAGISNVFSECPFEGGYDLSIGTSERGKDAQSDSFKLRPFRHLLIVLGGLGGIEDAIEGDERLQSSTADQMFDHYMNACINQGSRTIRTEEAMLICLSVLHPRIRQNEPPPPATE